MTHPASVEMLLVNAFTPLQGEGGNAAGVVLDADDLTMSDRQAIAAAAGLSETAFVSSSDVASIRLEFFTPRRQIAHCGHATIATFGYLGQAGLLDDGAHSKETIDGVRGVDVAGSYASMEQVSPRYAPVDQARVLTALGLTSQDLDPRFPPERVDTGNGFIVVGVRNLAVLMSLACDFADLDAMSELYDLVGFYVFSTVTEDPSLIATTRMFAPRYGIEEEAATGMAAGPLACLLHREGVAPVAMSIEQGRYMIPPSPSRIDVTLDVDAGRIARLAVGGTARVTGSRTVLFASAAAA